MKRALYQKIESLMKECYAGLAMGDMTDESVDEIILDIVEKHTKMKLFKFKKVSKIEPVMLEEK